MTQLLSKYYSLLRIYYKGAYSSVAKVLGYGGEGWGFDPR